MLFTWLSSVHWGFYILLVLVITKVAGVNIKFVILSIMNIYKWGALQWLKLRGLTPDDVSEQRIVTGQAWAEFCDTLKAAGASVMSPGSPMDPFNQAEGYRYLTRLTRAGLEVFLEAMDPPAPKLVSIVDGHRMAPIKIGSDNPDNFYQCAQITTNYMYRLYGTRETVHYLGFGTQSGQYGKAGGLKTVDYIEATDIQYEDDREHSFSIICSVHKPKYIKCKNWLKLNGDILAGMLIVRNTFNDRMNEKRANVLIERVEDTPEFELAPIPTKEHKHMSQSSRPKIRPSALTCAKVEDALSSTGLLVAGASMMFTRWVSGFQSHINQLPLFDQKKSDNAGGDPNIRYYHSYYKLDVDECLIIDTNILPSEHWNFQLDNHWLESLDYQNYDVHVNKHTATYSNDQENHVRIIVSCSEIQSDEEAPDNITWLTTVGHTCGGMTFRWIKPQVSDQFVPTSLLTQVVKREDALSGQYSL